MAWLTSLLKKPDAEEQQPLLEEELTPEEAPEPIPEGPQLAVLVPDTAGISSFRLAMRPTAATAGEYIASLRAEVRHETHAFWAMHERPIVDENTQVEALVLIRAQAQSDLVYVVSFLDLESALSFTRFEVRRGLHLGNVMIYWAAFAQLREELEGISVSPEYAPPTVDYHLPIVRHEPAPAPQPSAPVAAAEPEPQTRAPEPVAEAAPEAVAAQPVIEESIAPPPVIERPAVRTPQPAPEPEIPAEEPVIEESVATPPVIEQPAAHTPQPAPQPMAAAPATEPHTYVDDDEDLGPLWPEAQAAAPAGSPAEDDTEFGSPVAEEQAAIDEAFVFQHKSMEFRPLNSAHRALEAAGEANGMLVDHDEERLPEVRRDRMITEAFAARLRAAEPEPVVETVPGDEEVEFVPLASMDASAPPQARKLDDFDVAYEVERLLRHRKWEQRDGPFSGFQSPPGRF
jgi:hypothetical protein